MDNIAAEKPNTGKRVKTVALRLLLLLLVTLLLLIGFVYAVMLLLCKGPSPTARDLFVLSTHETSAIGFLPRLVLSESEIREIEAGRSQAAAEVTDSSLVSVQLTDRDSGPVADAWGYTDEDGDGLILVPVAGESFTGHMLIVLDPSRVILGCVPETFHLHGYTLEELVEHFGAVAAINGGGFYDPGGMGNGAAPDTLVVMNGVVYAGGNGLGNGWVGIDDQYILHVGLTQSQEVYDKHIQQGVGYGPVLVVNGEASDPSVLLSGLNPRTAIGQRSDGAILMLVIAGRQPNSLGATYADEAELMLRFGAVNACNLDGGTSSLLWYDGGYLNNSATVVGIRDIPTGFMVMPEGVNAGD